MVQTSSIYWSKFTAHILKHEGGLSKNPADTAVSCAPFAGAYHTNKGVTYCTFKKLAPKFGLPVTYEKFKTLTDYEVGLFIYEYYKTISGDKIPDSVAISMTEAAWGSGPVQAIKHLQDALALMGKKVSRTGKMDANTITAANSVNAELLFNTYWKIRQQFIDSLTIQPKYAMFKKGWDARIKNFLTSFSGGLITTGSLFLVLATVFF